VKAINARCPDGVLVVGEPQIKVIPRSISILLGMRRFQVFETCYRDHYGLETRFELVLDTNQMPEYRPCFLEFHQAPTVYP